MDWMRKTTSSLLTDGMSHIATSLKFDRHDNCTLHASEQYKRLQRGLGQL